MAIPGIPAKASGNISPCRFVKGTGTNHTYAQNDTAGGMVLGISQEGASEPPIPENTTLYAAQDGQSFRVFLVGEVCLLELSGTVQAGGEIQSHTDGTGIAASAADYVGAIALEDGASGEKIQVRVVQYEKNA